MNWNVGPEVLNWVAMTITQTSVISVTASASTLTSRDRASTSPGALSAGSDGTSATSTAPTSGMAPATVSQGKPFIYSLTTRRPATSSTAPMSMDSA